MSRIEADDPIAISRRDLGKALAAAGLALVALPAVPRRSAAAGDLHYFTWSGYEVPELHQPYVDKHGGSPEISFFGDEEEAMQKLRQGFAPDIGHPCSYIVPRWRDAELLAPVDTGRIEAWPDVFEGLKAIPGTESGGERWWVPTDWGYNSIAYRTDLVDFTPEEESWQILFDEKYEGRIAMYSAMDQLVFAAAAAAGIEDIYAMTPEEEAKVKELLLKQKELLRFYWDDPTQVEQALAAGEIVAAFAWAASATTLKQQGLPVRYMNPKEGTQTWTCGLALLAEGEGSRDAAYDFINAWLAPQSGKFILESYGYGHANKASFALVDPQLLADLGLQDPDDLFARTSFMEVFDPETRERYIDMVDEVMASS